MKLARMPDGGPEIFHTLQGEGRNIGRPSVFIRASLCNLHCRWCDTDYTWNWDDTEYVHDNSTKYRREEQIIDRGAEEIVTHVQQYPCSHYVFTGGEPLLQEREWLRLMELLAGSFEIETNGTLLPSDEFFERIDQLNVSPKLANSGVERERRLDENVLRALASSGKADFKFVVGSPEDFAEIESLLDSTGIAADRVFLMPEARTPAELEENQGFVSELALAHGLRYSDRLHLRLYGAKRGT